PRYWSAKFRMASPLAHIIHIRGIPEDGLKLRRSRVRQLGKRRLFYGWVVVAGAFTSFAISAGLMHSFTVFFVAFLEEFRWSRADTSVAYSTSQLIIGASAPLIGALVDRLGPRLLVLLGGIILAVGLAANALVSTLWQLVLLYGLVMTIGANCLGPLVSAPLVSR